MANAPEITGVSPQEAPSPNAARAHPADSSRAARREGRVSWAIAFLLVAPSVAWIARDRSVWSWDPASYATESFDLWFELTNEPAQWLRRMRTVFPAKAPGTPWLGQLFVPAGRWLGSVETGLLLSVVVTQLAALILTFKAGRSVAPRSVLPAAIGTVFVAAAPMFVATSHHFLTEPLQLFSIAYLLWVAAEASSAPPLRMLLHLALAVTIGVVAKLSTPAFVVFPAAIAAVRVFRGIYRRRAELVFGGREAFLAVLLAAVLGLGLAWYLRNWKHVYEFAKLATSGDVALDYGRRGTIATKLGYWLPAMGRTLATEPIAWVLAAAVVAAAVASLRRVRREPAGREREAAVLVVAALAQLLFVLYVLVTSINEETRYLLALAPMIAVVLAWLGEAVRTRWVLVPLLLALAGQWGVVHARQLGLAGGAPASRWEKPPSAEGARIAELSRVESEVCRRENGPRAIVIGVDLDWLNYCTFTFYSAKAQLERKFRCGYDYLGHAQKDPDAGFRKLRENEAPYFVSLDESAMPDPPDFLNKAARAVLKRVREDPRFVQVPLESPSRIVVFQHVGAW